MNQFAVDRLSVRNWPFRLDLLPNYAYMVGGAVRDAILGRIRDYLDLDFIVAGDAIQIAKQIAKECKAGFVLLDAERDIARVVFANATADFAKQDGDSLNSDLKRRDFTINAIAYNPYNHQFIDPLGGCQDIASGMLRMISRDNLQNDPLRLMRAYRQAAQLGFKIEPNTQVAIRSLALELSKVASERIRVEIGYLLSSNNGTFWLIKAWEDGLLTRFFQNSNYQSVQKLNAVEKAYILISQKWEKLASELQNHIRNTIKTSGLSIAKIACLVNSKNLDLVERELLQLTYSRVEIRAVITVLKLLPKITSVNNLINISIREQYFLFQEISILFPVVLILAIAENIIAQETPTEILPSYEPLVNRYLNCQDLVAHPHPLLSGNDIMKALQIPASPKVGELLTEIAIAQGEGIINNLEEAIAYAAKLL
ncbi:CCA tRNA nucleotidyltransferase [Anabaena sp. FACHB-1237]|uniref:CCA tRNA nucleotidyltransferase n=1 Tax=Anabaena sp. FACHB-1237 TaxID=2692769 RepID=UPI0016811A4E|nr:CCA tRNA nucleotidyltransferase [Anabaena sp. FACHB-1237]MBD2138895.1 CCA tRNA nucleotidyltransferase [Anabaena sp. FACHB-1237]